MLGRRTWNQFLSHCQYLFFLVLIFATSAVVQADQLQLTNGRVVQGALVQETPTEYIFKTSMGTIRVNRSEVVKFTNTQTRPAEVDGDAAAEAGRSNDAVTHYRTALSQVPAGGEGALRLQEKLAALENKISQTQSSSAVNALRQGQASLQSGNLDVALRNLQEAVRMIPASDPASSTARTLLAQTHYQKALVARDAVDEREVENQLKSAISVCETFSPAYLLYGELLLRTSNTAPAGVKLIERGLELAGESLSERERVRYNYTIARYYFNWEDYESAASRYASAMQSKVEYPEFSDALERTVESYIKMGEKNVASDFGKTIDNLNRALELTPDATDALFLLGRIYSDTGRTTEAITTLRRVITLDPKYPDSNYYLAKTYLDERDYDNALIYYSQELQNDPNNYDAMVERAEVHIALAEYEKAMVGLTAAQQLEPQNWRAFLLSGKLALQQEALDNAQRNLQQVLAIKLEPEAYILMGKVFLAKKQPAEARKWFEEVVKSLSGAGENLPYRLKNIMAEAQTELGVIDLVQDSPRQAETRLKQALSLVDNFAPALNKIGDVKKRLGSDSTDPVAKQTFFQEAESSYQAALVQEPNNPEFVLSLGILYHNHLKNPAKALEYYNRYVELGGRDSEVAKWIMEVGGVPPSSMVTESMLADVMGTGTVALTTATLGMTTGTEMLTTGSVEMTTETAVAPLPTGPVIPEAVIQPGENVTTIPVPPQP